VRRDQLQKRTGTFQVPYLEDPNTNVNLFESAEIIEYIESQYGVES
jgi:glutathione S-transferase